MSRNNWSVYEEQSGGSWLFSNYIYRPNQTMPIGIDSRLAPYNLADGSIGTVISSTKYSSAALTMTWKYVYYTDTLLATLEDYIKNATYLRITDHLTNTYEGTFKNVQEQFLVGEDNYFDINATFFRH